MRWALIALGWTMVGVGVVGIVVPGLPTTPFLLVAAWAFARSSERFRHWLLNHRLFGPPIVAWQRHGAVPTSAKVLAVAMMAASLAYVAFFTTAPRYGVVAMGVTLAVIAAWLVSRPRPPTADP
jgi:uncharacterized membrane protein YbaN (DUF454 family)